MKTSVCLKSARRVLLAFLLSGGLASLSPAQKVPIGFNDFHGYTGTTEYLKKVVAAYPGITELLEIGKSTKGRPLYVLVISNIKTGATIDRLVTLRHPRSENVNNVAPMMPYQGKPGQWIDGGTHGNEFTGSEVCLYIINKLVSGYGSDKEITDLVDNNAFYICPVVNPDGVFNSVEAGISQRANSMMEDDDKDGKVNEDGPDDLDGDGFIAQFRYKDPKGRYVMDDKDPRIMIRLGENETTTKERYSVITEDKDNDGDGKRGEDPERGIDLNRNYPEGWWKDDDTPGGTGYYAASAPETRAVVEFFVNHTNIFLVQSYHTSGGFTYRPPARWPDARLDPKDAAVFDRIMGAKYLELLGEPMPAGWREGGPGEAGLIEELAPGQARPAAARPAEGGQAPVQIRGWRHPYNEAQRRPYGYGIFLDWAYLQFGSWAVSTELWNWQKDTRGLAGYKGEDDRVAWEKAYIAYQEKAFAGKAFIPWKKFKHPELGEGEIGGWVSKYSSNNAIPGESLLGICETHWQFELFKAKLMPRLRITDARAKVIYASDGPAAKADQSGDTFTIKKGQGSGRYKIVEVTATLENAGKLATHTSQGAQLPGNRQDVVWLIGAPGKVRYLEGAAWMRLGTLEGAMEIPGISAAAPAAETPRAGPRQMGMPGPGFPGMMQQPRVEEERVKSSPGKREVSWLVTVEGDMPLKIVLTSQKGGTVVKELKVD